MLRHTTFPTNSKYMLLQFLSSTAVLNACNGNKALIDSIGHFVNNHVFGHEELSVF